jgi:formimidoylglutamate deiminase
MEERALTKRLFARSALLPQGWAQNVLITLDHYGVITDAVTDQASPGLGDEVVEGFLLPGIANCHSHAFQRAMVGLAEMRTGGSDDFWGWRDVMYHFLALIGPEAAQAIAAQLYVEMLKAGYTGVAEFHYLHHAPGGTPYDDPAEMSHRIVNAAQEAGIQLTLLPVLYRYGGFGAREPHPQQCRFLHQIDDFERLLKQLAAQYGNCRNIRQGMALHSLRAVDESLVTQALTALDTLDTKAPVHIHIAEQLPEVDACIAHTGQRPVQWLLDHANVNERWCLVHSTHVDAQECQRLANSGAVAGLCLTTEANLGDGIFPALDYSRNKGRFAIGSDSHVSVSPVEELRLLEYGQRLQKRRRTLLAGDGSPSVGTSLYRQALEGGAQALGVKSGAIKAGYRADLIVLDSNDPVLYGKRGDQILDAWVFAVQRPAVKDVMVGGQWQVCNGRHRDEERIRLNYYRFVDELANHG